mmetsp:Transcript_13282/g.16695  ORF Transcript_13282/g.16695 Transcript_13282/m.16695 type:complete len:222 (+) Transcript_13282:72-737(+)
MEAREVLPPSSTLTSAVFFFEAPRPLRREKVDCCARNCLFAEDETLSVGAAAADSFLAAAPAILLPRRREKVSPERRPLEICFTTPLSSRTSADGPSRNSILSAMMSSTTEVAGFFFFLARVFLLSRALPVGLPDLASASIFSPCLSISFGIHLRLWRKVSVKILTLSSSFFLAFSSFSFLFSASCFLAMAMLNLILARKLVMNLFQFRKNPAISFVLLSP